MESATGTKAIESEVIEPVACDISMMAPDALKDYVGRSVTLRGSVYKIRKMSGFCFVLVRTARHVIQCVCREKELMEQLTEEACVKILADVVEEPRARFGAELHITGLEVLAMPAAQMPIVMNQKKIEASLENRLDYRPLVLRNERERAVFKLKEGILRGFRKFFESEHFTEIPRLKFSQAKVLVAEKAPGLFAGEKLPDQVAQTLAAAGDSHDFDPEEERLLSQIVMEETGSPFIFVTHYPTAKRPFYVMEDPDNPEETLSFDLIFRGLEITTGGQRLPEFFTK